MRSRPALLTTTRRLLLLGLLTAAAVLVFGRAAMPASAVGEGVFGLDKPEYVTQEGTAVAVTVNRTGGATLTQDVVVTVQLSEGTVDEDYPSGTITQTFSYKQGTNLASNTFMFQTLNKSRYFTRSVRVTILSVTGGGQIDFGKSTSPVRIVGIFAPTVTGLSVHSGNAGASGPVVSVTGTNFVASCGGVTINAGDPPCTDAVYFYPTSGGSPVVVTPFAIQSTTTISFLVPSVVGTYPNGTAFHVVVINQTGAASPNPAKNESVRTDADLFTYASGAAVTGVAPTSGTAAGGTTVILTGNAALSCGAAGPGNSFPAVTFGGPPYYATDCEFRTSNVTPAGTINTIRLKSPAHPPGAVDVSVFGSPPTQETKYTYTGGPQITAIAPAFGPQSGGTVISITGSGFLAQLAGPPSVLRVLVGGTDAVNPLFHSDTQITAVAPPGSGIQQVTVRTTLGDSPFTTNANFAYTSGPIIQSISPNNGPVTGGVVVTINGAGFLAGAIVKFGANASASVFVDSPTTIRAVSPAGAGNVDIVVAVNGNASPNTAADNFSYTGPTISSVTPNGGPIAGANVVSIKGMNFTSTMKVKFGALPVPPDKVVFVSQNEVTVTVPASPSAQAVDIQVETISGLSPIVFEDLYTYTNGPIVDALNPAIGPTTGGTIVIITGKNFTPGLTIKFGDVNADNLNVNSATQITVLTPPAAAAGIKDVRVTKGSDVSPVSAAAKFTFAAAVPIITTIEPNSSSTFGGQEVTIIGAGFSGVVCPGAVKFGTVPATSCTMVNDTTLKAVTPPNVSGQTVVTVTTTNGTSDIVPNFTYKSPSSGGGTGGAAPPPPGPAGTISYSLTFRWTLFTWFGRDGISIGDALRGYPPSAGSDITTRISAIFRYDAENAVYKGYFTLAEGIPGANDFSTLTRGAVYWVATVAPGEVPWTAQTG